MATKLLTTGDFNAVQNQFAGRYLCGVDGGPVKLREVLVGEHPKDGVPQIEFVCEVEGLKNRNGDDWEPIESQTVSAVLTLKGSRQMDFDKLNRALELTGDDRLEDDGESWFRLVAEDAPNSLVQRLTKPIESLYLSASFKPSDKNPELVGPVYFNLESPPVRKSKVKLADLKAKFGKPTF